MSASVTVYLRNGLSFAFAPSKKGLPPPSEASVAKLMSEANAVEAVTLATPRVVIRWADVVAVQIDEGEPPERADLAKAPSRRRRRP